jgi:hypothetical protein
MEDIKYQIELKEVKYRNQYNNCEKFIESIRGKVTVTSISYPEIVYEKKITVKFDPENFNSESFIPYEEVDLDTFINWMIALDGEADTIEQVEIVRNGIEYVQNCISKRLSSETETKDWVISN